MEWKTVDGEVFGKLAVDGSKLWELAVWTSGVADIPEIPCAAAPYGYKIKGMTIDRWQPRFSAIWHGEEAFAMGKAFLSGMPLEPLIDWVMENEPVDTKDWQAIIDELKRIHHTQTGKEPDSVETPGYDQGVR